MFVQMIMKVSANIARHIVLIIGIAAVLVLCTIYPFLPGTYDRLAMTLSTMAQVIGLAGLPLVLIGVLWVIIPRRRFVFAILSMIVCTFVMFILTLIATFSVGRAFGVITLAIGIYMVKLLVPKLKHMKNAGNENFNFTPLYLVTLPLVTLIFQLIFAMPVTEWSKSRSITNANEFIADIEKYHLQHGKYPLSLHAQYKDYNPDVVGVEKYFYEAQGNGYNLCFEQPRFLLDRPGTREWIVYNPRDEHQIYSHAAWRLLAEGMPEASQGWYASGNTRHLHWKYFLFD